ncbi:MAG: Rrf2 family transcriptional regulator [Candidatus Coatesbacteria bacterium]|nr:MAG: Rrf2 family transcriptional regulator [Candidatus Coatesbacteria bacterium]
MKMSTRGRFGLRSLLHLAARGENGPVSVSEIASEMDVSSDYLMQLFVKLRREGLLESMRGPRGGFKFARPAESITIGDVVRSVEGSLSPIHCVEEEPGRVIEEGDAELCEKAPTCPSRKAWVYITKKLVSLFDSITLADILRTGEEKGLLAV